MVLSLLFGRRCPDDLRQIKRWRALRRHITQVKGIARRAIFLVAADSDRPCYTGLMIPEKSKRIRCMTLLVHPGGSRETCEIVFAIGS